MTAEQAFDLLNELDDFAIDQRSYGHGLPLCDEDDRMKLIQIVLDHVERAQRKDGE